MTQVNQFEQEGGMRMLALLISSVLVGCASTQREDELVLTYYYLRF